MRRNLSHDALILALLAVLAIATRLLPHAPGFVAVTAATLFAGWHLRRRPLALAFPLGVMLLSDLVIGYYELPVMLAVYAGTLLPVLVSRWIGANVSFVRVAGLALLCSVTNFLAINFVVWLAGGWYERSLAGLLECYVAGIPFFKYRAAGDLFWSGAIFGTFVLANALSQRLQTANLRKAEARIRA